jgi:hypothetical protein
MIRKEVYVARVRALSLRIFTEVPA